MQGLLLLHSVKPDIAVLQLSEHWISDPAICWAICDDIAQGSLLVAEAGLGVDCDAAFEYEAVFGVDMAPEGELSGGELSDDRAACGADVISEGELSAGELSEGELSDDDGAVCGIEMVPEGELSVGEFSEGELSEGELSDDDGAVCGIDVVSEGELSEGELSEGKLSVDDGAVCAVDLASEGGLSCGDEVSISDFELLACGIHILIDGMVRPEQEVSSPLIRKAASTDG
jgi:hypothetical protein